MSSTITASLKIKLILTLILGCGQAAAVPRGSPVHQGLHPVPAAARLTHLRQWAQVGGYQGTI